MEKRNSRNQLAAGPRPAVAEAPPTVSPARPRCPPRARRAPLALRSGERRCYVGSGSSRSPPTKRPFPSLFPECPSPPPPLVSSFAYWAGPIYSKLGLVAAHSRRLLREFQWPFQTKEVLKFNFLHKKEKVKLMHVFSFPRAKTFQCSIMG